jgi:hypothetical protein
VPYHRLIGRTSVVSCCLLIQETGNASTPRHRGRTLVTSIDVSVVGQGPGTRGKERQMKVYLAMIEAASLLGWLASLVG